MTRYCKCCCNDLDNFCTGCRAFLGKFVEVALEIAGEERRSLLASFPDYHQEVFFRSKNKKPKREINLFLFLIVSQSNGWNTGKRNHWLLPIIWSFAVSEKFMSNGLKILILHIIINQCGIFCWKFTLF